jgi:hypothetical protein
VGDLLNNPAVQSSVVPFLAGLAVGGALFAIRLGGLAAAAGLFATVYLVGDFTFESLDSKRKLVLVAMAAPLLGAIADLAFKPTRASGPVLGLVFAAAGGWVFLNLLKQKTGADLALYCGGLAAFMVWNVAATVSLQGDGLRAGAAGLGLGLGAGVGAVLGASALLGQYGMGLGAGCGAFLLLAMILGARVAPGVALTLTASAAASLVAAGAMLTGQFPWYALAALAFVPVLVRLPLPRGAAWMQGIVAALYAAAAAVGAWVLAWLASRGASA